MIGFIIVIICTLTLTWPQDNLILSSDLVNNSLACAPTPVLLSVFCNTGLNDRLSSAGKLLLFELQVFRQTISYT